MDLSFDMCMFLCPPVLSGPGPHMQDESGDILDTEDGKQITTETT